jgi:hypothetical protein
MSAKDIIAKFNPEEIIEAAHQLEIAKKMKHIFENTRWKDTPVLQDKKSFIIPLLDYNNRRPLAVTLHGYGIWIEPIYTAYNGGLPDKDFALHIDEEEDGLWIHIEDVLSMIISGSYESGFRLEIKEKDKNTEIIDTTPIYR